MLVAAEPPAPQRRHQQRAERRVLIRRRRLRRRDHRTRPAFATHAVHRFACGNEKPAPASRPSPSGLTQRATGRGPELAPASRPGGVDRLWLSEGQIPEPRPGVRPSPRESKPGWLDGPPEASWANTAAWRAGNWTALCAPIGRWPRIWARRGGGGCGPGPVGPGLGFGCGWPGRGGIAPAGEESGRTVVVIADLQQTDGVGGRAGRRTAGGRRPRRRRSCDSFRLPARRRRRCRPWRGRDPSRRTSPDLGQEAALGSMGRTG